MGKTRHNQAKPIRSTTYITTLRLRNWEPQQEPEKPSWLTLQSNFMILKSLIRILMIELIQNRLMTFLALNQSGYFDMQKYRQLNMDNKPFPRYTNNDDMGMELFKHSTFLISKWEELQLKQPSVIRTVRKKNAISSKSQRKIAVDSNINQSRKDFPDWVSMKHEHWSNNKPWWKKEKTIRDQCNHLPWHLSASLLLYGLCPGVIKKGSTQQR